VRQTAVPKETPDPEFFYTGCTSGFLIFIPQFNASHFVKSLIVIEIN